MRAGQATVGEVAAALGTGVPEAAALLQRLARAGLASAAPGVRGEAWSPRLGRRAGRGLPVEILQATYRTLSDAFEVEGAAAALTADRPLSLQQAETAWLVRSGLVHVFAVPWRDGCPAGARAHLATVGPGGLLLGADPGGATTGLLAVAARQADVRTLPQARLWTLAAGGLAGPVAEGLGAWLTALSAGLRALPAPRSATALAAGRSDHPAAAALRPAATLWVRAEGAPAFLLGRPDLPCDADTGLPVGPAAWLDCAPGARLQAEPLAAWVGTGGAAGAAMFQGALLRALAADRREEEAEKARRAERRAGAAAAALEGGVRRLGSLLGHGGPVAEAGGPWATACAAVAAHLGLPPAAPARPAVEPRPDPAALAEAHAAAHGLRLRPVSLTGTWWKGDHGPLLAWRREDVAPVALLPGRRGYRLLDPAAGRAAPLRRADAATLAPGAWMPYRPFPEGPLRPAAILGYLWPLLRGELPVLLWGGLAVGVLAAVVPILTGVLVGAVIPGGHRAGLAALAAALGGAALAGACFTLAQRLVLLRAQGRIGPALQAALWDRLLSLPPSFFRGMAAGDIAQRANAFDVLVDALGGTPAFTLWSGVFALCSGALLLYYDAALAAAALGLAVAAAGAVLLFADRARRHFRLAYAASGRVAGRVLELLVGMPKLRAAGAERQAFAHWAGEYAQQRAEALRAGSGEVALQTLSAALPAAALAVILALLVGHSVPPALPVSRFLAFNAAFGQLLGAVLGAGPAMLQAGSVLPLFERVRPILEARPETAAASADPGELVGAVECRRLSFRYSPDGPLVLHDVSFHADPGEFIALVGPSGSGKSTLFRLLLGFDTPESGGVFYDRQDLSRLDLRAARRQIGVALQSSRLMAGTIYDNIAGGMRVTMDEAREAARLAGLDRDLESMPMGLFTYVVDGGGTLSGGQRQKVLLARALVKRPRILLLDEATSALDNRAQEAVRESLDALHATRIVIAHRLSTIRRADRIYVLEAGAVVQEGTYEQLLAEGGVFGRLVQRQLSGQGQPGATIRT